MIAIERDRDLVAALRAEALPANVELVEADAVAFDYASECARGPTSLVGNLPYQLTGKLVRAMLVPPIRWRVAVIMVQREVAARLMARPGTSDWGVLGVFTSAACEITKVTDASPGCFHPAPKVTSTVVKLTPRATPLAEETPWLQRVVHALFQARRKTATNGLASIPQLGRAGAIAVLAAAGIDPMRRPETFAVEEFGRIAAEAARYARG